MSPHSKYMLIMRVAHFHLQRAIKLHVLIHETLRQRKSQSEQDKNHFYSKPTINKRRMLQFSQLFIPKDYIYKIFLSNFAKIVTPGMSDDVSGTGLS